MSDAKEFRASTDHMLQLVDRLRAVEQAKQNVDFGSPEFITHANTAHELARLVFRWAGMQLQMAEAAAGAVERGEQPSAPLVEVTPRSLDRVLAAWREAQLRFELAQPGSPEAATAANDLERFREEYHAAAAARSASRD